MTQRPRYIVVPNWDSFQHYSDRTPPWIKNYTELLHDDAYLGLTLHQRGVLHGIWLAYAASHRQLSGDTSALYRQLGERVSTATLIALNRAGFIELTASRPLAQSRGRGEESSKGRTVSRGPARTRATLPIEITQELDKLWPRLKGVDANSRKVVEQAAAGLPQSSIAKVRESVETNGRTVGVGYVVNALKSERREREAGRGEDP